MMAWIETKFIRNIGNTVTQVLEMCCATSIITKYCLIAFYFIKCEKVKYNRGKK